MPTSLLFSAALFALPLVALPLILHLLFRRKSPVMMFSTLRFIRASLQHTAARRKVQRWLLLACRALAILLLILIAAQPVRILASGRLGSGRSISAAIVVDTSYSMLARDQGSTLLARADAMTRQLLRGPLSGAKIVLLTSRESVGMAPRWSSAGETLTQWTAVRPQGNPAPLSDRAAAAMTMLANEPADQKLLVIVSDFQKKEFPRAIAAGVPTQVVLLDLHPSATDNAGIAGVAIDPPQPIAGVGADAVIDVAGTSRRGRPVTVSVEATDGTKLCELPVQVANLDASGRARLRVPLTLPAQRWLVLRAALSDEDDMAWDNSRRTLIELPPRQTVSLLANPRQSESMRFVALALDPSAGTSKDWPLVCQTGPEIAKDAGAIVELLDQWPTEQVAAQRQAQVREGRTLIWFLRPGLEQSWSALPESHRAALRPLLPGEPAAERVDESPATLGVANTTDPLLAGLSDRRFALDTASVLRMVRFNGADAAVTVLLSAFPVNPHGAAQPAGFLFRRPVGTGMVFTFATLPDPQFTNLPTHPLFLPLLVRVALPSASAATSANVELGQPLICPGRIDDAIKSLRLIDPQGAQLAVNRSGLTDGRTGFTIPGNDVPGLYRWQKPGDSSPIALSAVEPAATESTLEYGTTDMVAAPGPNVVAVQSVEELEKRLASSGQGEPRWTPLVAALLALLCAEAFVASAARSRRN